LVLVLALLVLVLVLVLVLLLFLLLDSRTCHLTATGHRASGSASQPIVLKHSGQNTVYDIATA
jgi:hypothetical protein